ncbi:MAG: pyridoxamine 5'-phosphate oxidase family protein [Candidatus Micrarchaeota archaeon]|nr:pyridoxamine 5'-phosphate oxidase family protein [Candidatus Micrarchaeota archaeon]
MQDKNESYEEEAKRLISDNKYMVVATSDKDGNSWAATVFYVYDKKYNFYFLSAVDSRHCEFINKNPKVAFVIFDANQPIGHSEGIQALGRASFVKDRELEEVIKLYSNRLFPKSTIPPGTRYPKENYGEASEFRFYKIEVSNLYVTGTIDRRTEVDRTSL